MASSCKIWRCHRLKLYCWPAVRLFHYFNSQSLGRVQKNANLVFCQTYEKEGVSTIYWFSISSMLSDNLDWKYGFRRIKTPLLNLCSWIQEIEPISTFGGILLLCQCGKFVSWVKSAKIDEAKWITIVHLQLSSFQGCRDYEWQLTIT